MDLEFFISTTTNMAAHMRWGLRQLLRAKNTAHFRFDPAVIYDLVRLSFCKIHVL